jgi:cell division protein FtsB
MMPTPARPKRKRRWRLLFFVPFWLLIVVISLSVLYLQASTYLEYKRELDRVTADIRTAENEYEDIQNKRAYYESDAYIEQLAREMLGYIRPDEIVFYNVAD